jgi:hypothetical protein
MHAQCQNHHNNPQMEIAMQQMVEAHTEMTLLITQDMVNRDSKMLPQECSSYWRIILE